MYGRVVKIGGRLGRRAGRRCQRILGGMERERGGGRGRMGGREMGRCGECEGERKYVSGSESRSLCGKDDM